MKFACTTLLLLAPLTPALAQDDAIESMPMATPAPQLDKLSGYIGQFEGSGTYTVVPGMDPMEWTSKATGVRVLDGHAVQVHEIVQTSFGPMEFRSLYAWDAQGERLVGYWISTEGIESGGVFWADDKTLVSVTHGTLEGLPFADRSKTTFTAEGYTIRVDRMAGTEEPFQLLSGEMKRVKAANTIEAAITADAPALPPGKEMAALAPMIGTWNVAGAVNMMGMEMDITALETNEWMMGSAVIASHVHGQSGDYLMDSYIGFNAQTGEYRQVYASNIGELGMFTGRMVDGQLVMTGASLELGVPSVVRGVSQFKDGGILKVWSDSITGVGDTVRAFQATYTRALKFSAGSCCAKAEAAGGACKHPCCIAAAEKGEVCARCNQ